MPDMRWMLYGATGYTGKLLVQEAVNRGHRPVLAGRSMEKLENLADQYDLEAVAFGLDDVNTIAEAIADVDIVFHAAGPFVHTSDPMIRACLATRTHYLDISGDLPVFENTFGYDDAARKNGVALISGVGFDVLLTDCMAKYVADQVPGATTLDIGIATTTRPSAGTAKSGVEMLPGGGKIRRDGKLQSFPFGQGRRTIQFSHGEYTAMPVPWGDLSTGYRSTGIANIITYLAVPSAAITMARLFAPAGQWLFRYPSARRIASGVAGLVMRGSSAEMRYTARSYIYACASDAAGKQAEAWLETAEPYRFTRLAGIRALEQTAALNLAGVLSPAMAFGEDFVLDVPDTTRLDRLEG